MPFSGGIYTEHCASGKIFRNFYVPENFSWERQEGEIYSGNIHKLSKDGRWRHRVLNIFEFFPQDAIPTFPPEKPFFFAGTVTRRTLLPLIAKRHSAAVGRQHIDGRRDACGKNERGTYFFAHLFALSSFTMLLPLTGADV